jgi:hypothetical protein
VEQFAGLTLAFNQLTCALTRYVAGMEPDMHHVRSILVAAWITELALCGAFSSVHASTHSRSYAIEGIVRDALNKPLGSALVTLKTRNGHILQHTRTGPDGHFIFSGLDPGKYLLVAEKINYHLTTKVVTAEPAGHLAPVVLTLAVEPGRVEGRRRAPWTINTSGPFFTGTADTEPWGSWYYEPWLYNYRTPSQGTSEFYMPQRLAIGLGHHLELDNWLTIDGNVVGPPTTPIGKSASYFGVGNMHTQLKYQWLMDADTYTFWARPSISTNLELYFPTGKYTDLKPSLYGADQLGNGTYNQGVSILLRKRFKPFEVYFQVTDLVEDPTRVYGGYTFNNGITVVPLGESLRMVDGNLLSYSGAFEHVLTDWGLGYVLEFYGAWQSSQNLFFGHANAPAWSFLWLDPGIEFNWPNTRSFVATWGFAVALPVAQWGYPRIFTPMATVTFYWNGGGARGE